MNKFTKYRTYELNLAVINRIDATAKDLDIYQSTLVQALLTDGLERLERGELKLPVKPRPTKMRMNVLR